VDLYRQLARDRFPVCSVCGATHMEEEHCKQPESKRKARPSRQGEGVTVELPPAAGAAELFQGVIKKLERNASGLWRRKEYLKNKRYTVY